MGDGTSIPEELIPRCPVCGAEAFPWVHGYGNFLQGRKYEEQYQKISKYIMNNKEKKILFLEPGVGRMTPDVRLTNDNIKEKYGKQVYRKCFCFRYSVGVNL